MKTTIPKIKSTRTSTTKGIAATTAKRIALLKIGIDTGMSKLIVQLSLLVIRQDFVGFGNLFEFFGRRFVVLQYVPKVEHVKAVQGGIIQRANVPTHS